jgi:hypothetical protein
VIPKAWDDKEVAEFEMRLARADGSPHYMMAKEYYVLTVRPIYRSYPVYAPGREPAGYIESLKQKEPEIILTPRSSGQCKIGFRPANWSLSRTCPLPPIEPTKELEQASRRKQ